MKENEIINLKDILKILWDAKIFISGFAFIFFVLGILYSLSLTDLYKANALLKLTDQENRQVRMSSGLSGLASLAGININQGASEKIYFVESYIQSIDLFEEVINENLFKEKLFASKKYDKKVNQIIINENLYDTKQKIWINEPSLVKTHQFFITNILDLKVDNETSFIEITISHVSPIFAKALLEKIIFVLNKNIREKDFKASNDAIEYLSKAISEVSFSEIKLSLNDMLKIELNKQMITNIKEEYIVEYIQKPFIPENKYYPKRTQLTFFFTLFGLLISILYILFKHYIFVKNKKNP